MVIWCGHIKPVTVVNDIYYHEDWLPTLLDAVGEPDSKEKLHNGHLKAANYFKSNQK
jgi:arylsulfatase